MENILNLTDQDLLALCQKYGKQAIFWRRKFIGLLPEVDKRELYSKKRCSNIYEFAAKFGGVTKKHTQRVIQIDKTFEEKGVKVLREMLQEGAASINKLAKIVSVIGMIEEGELVAAIKKLSCTHGAKLAVCDKGAEPTNRTLETYVVDLRRAFGNYESTDVAAKLDESLFWGNGSPEPLFGGKSVHVNTFAEGEKAENGGEKTDTARSPMGDAKMAGTNTVEMQSQAVALKKLKLNLSEETLEEMLELQGKGIDVDALLKGFLQNREENIAGQKEETVKKVTGREERRKEEGKKPVRQISVKVKRILKEEYGTQCAVGGCEKEATQIHHTLPFSINGSNSPDLLKPLCRAHHDIVHSVNERYLERKGMG